MSLTFQRSVRPKNMASGSFPSDRSVSTFRVLMASRLATSRVLSRSERTVLLLSYIILPPNNVLNVTLWRMYTNDQAVSNCSTQLRIAKVQNTHGRRRIGCGRAESDLASAIERQGNRASAVRPVDVQLLLGRPIRQCIGFVVSRPGYPVERPRSESGKQRLGAGLQRL